MVFDVTHSLQLPGAGDGVTAGLAEYIEPLASAGVAAGVDAVFMEVHEEPGRAKSDAANALRLDKLEALLRKLKRLDAIVRETPATVRVRSRMECARDGRYGTGQKGAADRSGRDSSARRPARRLVRAGDQVAHDLPRTCDRDRDREVGNHLPEDCRNVFKHRHARILSASS